MGAGKRMLHPLEEKQTGDSTTQEGALSEPTPLYLKPMYQAWLYDGREKRGACFALTPCKEISRQSIMLSGVRLLNWAPEGKWEPVRIGA